MINCLIIAIVYVLIGFIVVLVVPGDRGPQDEAVAALMILTWPLIFILFIVFLIADLINEAKDKRR